MKQTLLLLAMVLMASTAYCQKKQGKPVSELDAMKPLGKTVKVGEWYRIPVKDATSSDGSMWTAMIRKGSSNNVMIIFNGGGISTDTYTAARGITQCKNRAEGFYIDNMRLLAKIRTGYDQSIASPDAQNPFKDWTFVVLPYTTGDLHCGTNDLKYTTADGKEAILHHHGYTNFQNTMNVVRPLLGDPDALVITGFSAGGFGTSILSDDVIQMFPKTQNVTVCVDAACLRMSNWEEVAKKVWGAPEHICERIEGEFISLDCLRALHRDRPEVKIIFAISPFDEVLAQFQTYYDHGKMSEADSKALDVWHSYLIRFCEEYREAIPEGGLFIWNDIVTNKETGATQHTIEYGKEVFQDLGGHGSFIQWLYDAYKGEVKTYGLELL